MKRFKTRAKTAYGLLSEIRKLILAEPKRYNQYDTLTLQGRGENYYWGQEGGFPSCGTIGCVAGWATALTSPRPSAVTGIVSYAKKVLGLSNVQADTLFDSHAAGAGSVQSQNHAFNGAAHIAKFQAANSRQLKAKRIK